MQKAIFFDVDDTLLNTSGFAQIARIYAIEAMLDAGLPLEKEEAFNILMDIIKEKGSNYDKHFNVLTKRVFGKEKPGIIAVGMITYHNVKFALLRPFPKTNSVLLNLSKEYRLGVISNGKTIKQWEKLVRLNLQHYFDEIVTSEEVGYEKPSREIFDEALKRMDCKAEDSIMVGDKFDTDIIGALEVGMSAILVNSELKKEEAELLKKGNYEIKVIENIKDLPKVL